MSKKIFLLNKHFFQVPQWAGWALKTISEKFYKSTTVTPVVSSTTTNSNIAQKDAILFSNNAASVTTATKIPEEKQQSIDILDGWGDLVDIDHEVKEFLNENSGKLKNNVDLLIGKNLNEFGGWGIDNDEIEEVNTGENMAYLTGWNEFEEGTKGLKEMSEAKKDLNNDKNFSAEADWSTDWEKVIFISIKLKKKQMILNEDKNIEIF